MISNPRLRLGFAIAAGAIVITAWTAVAIMLLLFEPSVALRTGAIMGAALLTEALLWAGAALLGITLFDRLRIWRRKQPAKPD